jgi:hypothetical protein
MMTVALGHLVITRHGRAVRIQMLNDATYYAALRIFGTRDIVAQALTANLITITITTKGN